MDIPYLRSEFLSEREFLHFLYSSKARKIPLKLSKATEKQLNILIKICHLISVGRISIRQIDFETLKKSKRLNFFTSHFNRRDNFLSILSASRDTKIKELKKISALFSNLLYTMFNK